MSIAEALQDEAFFRYMRSVRSSSRVSIEGSILESSIVTFWHEWMLCVLAGAIGLPRIAVCVWHQPGLERTVSLINRLGVHVIAARQDNAYGVRELREWLAREKSIVAITLDGPNGPRRVAKSGVVRLARLAKVPLHPLDVTASPVFELNGWDHCVMPATQNHIALRVLPAMPATGSPAEGAQLLESALSRTVPTPDLRRGWARYLSWSWARACTMPLQFGTATLWPD